MVTMVVTLRGQVLEAPDKPNRYIGAKVTPQDQSVPYGFCHCGCGQKTSIAKRNTTKHKYVKGQPMTYVRGHQGAQVRLDMTNAAPFKIDGVYCRLIPLTQGLFAIVDAADYEWLSRKNWCALRSPLAKRFYAERKGSKMHREILGLAGDDPIQVDHRNLNSLDNRRANLRTATHTENMQNRGMHSTNTSGFKGVHWAPRPRPWRARLTAFGKSISLGQFDTPEEAHRAYCEAVARHHGQFAREK